MTVYCPNTPTLVSTDGGDYIQYPPGTDVEVLPVNLAYSLFYSWNNYKPGKSTNYWESWDALYINGTVLAMTPSGVITVGNSRGQPGIPPVSDLLLVNNAVIQNGAGFTFTVTGSYEPIGVRHNLYRLYYDGNDALGYEAGGNGLTVFTKTINAFRLKITTP